ncbi:MAG: CADD family putative folate metabolism protein [Pseudomonadota bacterium]
MSTIISSEHNSTSRRADSAINAKRMLDHPYYKDWVAGRLDIETLQDYARQYFHHVEAFPRAVSQAHCLCDDAEGRRMLAENLAEEEGVADGKTDHPTLWLEFAEGLGACSDSVREATVRPETQQLIKAFRDLSSKSFASALGALYAYESQIPDIARTKIDGLKTQYKIDDPRTLKFFTVHEAADEEHAEVCRDLMDRLEADEAADAVDAAGALANALWVFLDGVDNERRQRAA